MKAALLEYIYLELPDSINVNALMIKDLRNAIRNVRSKSSEYDKYMYYCNTEDGRITVFGTYVDYIVLAEGEKEEVQGMVDRPLKRYEGGDKVGPLMETDEGNKLD